jgi:hypothetical protein
MANRKGGVSLVASEFVAGTLSRAVAEPLTVPALSVRTGRPNTFCYGTRSCRLQWPEFCTDFFCGGARKMRADVTLGRETSYGYVL